MAFKSETITYVAVEIHRVHFCSSNGHPIWVGPHKIRKLPSKTVSISVWIQDPTFSGASVLFVNFYSG